MSNQEAWFCRYAVYDDYVVTLFHMHATEAWNGIRVPGGRRKCSAHQLNTDDNLYRYSHAH